MSAVKAGGLSGSSRACLALAAAIALVLASSHTAEGQTRCSYTGPPTNLLTVQASGLALAEIRRDGQEIVVSEFLQRPMPCSGGVPTVLNTDTIRVLLRGVDAAAEVQLVGGPFEPGATPEAGGASEIEVGIRGAGLTSEIVGTPGADELHWGPGGAHAGLNLNPHSAGDLDVDVTTRGRSAFLIARGAGGNDTIVPGPGATVPDDGVFSLGGRGDDVLVTPSNTYGILEGGPGNDVLVGGMQADPLEGEGGNDRVAGGGGGDEISGGRGRDLLEGGQGPDSFTAADLERDTIRCGPGRDSVIADRLDRLRGCERGGRLNVPGPASGRVPAL
jgi:RTX calcium-binding nonapeptide repeat (4 copies)